MIQSNSNLLGAVGQDLEGPWAGAFRHPSWGQLQSPEPLLRGEAEKSPSHHWLSCHPHQAEFWPYPFSWDHSSSSFLILLSISRRKKPISDACKSTKIVTAKHASASSPVSPCVFFLLCFPLDPVHFHFPVHFAPREALTARHPGLRIKSLTTLAFVHPQASEHHILSIWSHWEVAIGCLGIQDDPHCGDKETKVWPHKRYKWDLSHRFWGLHDNGGRLLRGPGQRLLLTLCSDY